MHCANRSRATRYAQPRRTPSRSILMVAQWRSVCGQPAKEGSYRSITANLGRHEKQELNQTPELKLAGTPPDSEWLALKISRDARGLEFRIRDRNQTDFQRISNKQAVNTESPCSTTPNQRCQKSHEHEQKQTIGPERPDDGENGIILVPLGSHRIQNSSSGVPTGMFLFQRKEGVQTRAFWVALPPTQKRQTPPQASCGGVWRREWDSNPR